MQKIIEQWAITHGCNKNEAAVMCRTRLTLALVRGLSHQLERGFPLAGVVLEKDSLDDLLAF